MKSLVQRLILAPAWAVFLASGLITALVIVLFALGAGAAGAPAYDDGQNREFRRAFDEKHALPAYTAAPGAAGKEVAKAANHYLQTGEIYAASWTVEGQGKPDEAVGAWKRRHLCQLDGWGPHRALVRKLVAEGFGDCTGLARFAARAPWIYSHGTMGWLYILLGGLAVGSLVVFVVGLVLVRRVYGWLYCSTVAAKPGM